MTIGVPGNVPYVITVGAMSDNYTPADRSDDFLTSFSAAGPTVEGFVKPDVVAPGGHIMGIMPANARIALDYPELPPWRRLLHDVRHVTGDGRCQRHRRHDAAARRKPDAGRC